VIADELGRAEARRLYPSQPCEDCGARVAHRHHVNGDRQNNERSNIRFLCRRHHVAAHRVLDGHVGGGVRPRVNKMLRDRAVSSWGDAEYMRAQGLTVREAAAILGVHPVTVFRWRRKYAAMEVRER